MGTEEEAEIPEETPQECAASSSINEKVGFAKQSVVTLIYVADAIEKEFKEHAELKKLAKSRLEKIKSLEYQLNEEKVISTQLHQNLNKVNEELQWLRKEKEMNERNYS